MAIEPDYDPDTEYVNGELQTETDEFAAAKQKAIYTGHPELAYAAEQQIRDGASQEEAAEHITSELDKIYEGKTPDPEPEPHTLEDAAGTPEAALDAEQERVAEANAAAVGGTDQGSPPPNETAKQRKAREKAEAEAAAEAEAEAAAQEAEEAGANTGL